MFDVGFSEVLVCFIVALVVLGPERLPGVARAMGRWTGQAKAYLRNLSAELDRETQVGELKRQLEQAQSALRDHAQVIEGKATEVKAQVTAETAAIKHDAEAPKS